MKFDLSAPNPIAPFREIPHPRILERTIEQRLPVSSNIYNMMLMSSEPGSDIKWYTLGGLNHPGCWILTTFPRADTGIEYTLSGPTDPDLCTEESVAEILEGISTSALFDWTKICMFAAVEDRLAQKLCDLIDSKIQSNSSNLQTHFVPCLFFTANREDSLKIETSVPASFQSKQKIVVGSLRDHKDSLDFLIKNWRFARPGTSGALKGMLEKTLIRYPSAGVYLVPRQSQEDQEPPELVPVSGVLLKSHGAIGMLATDPDHQNKGLGSLCMKSMMKQSVAKEFIPCIHTEENDLRSINFHQKLGFHPSHPSHFIDVCLNS